jgi:hypothetical protein
MRQHAPPAVADAFIASRLAGGFRTTYAAAPGGGNARAVLSAVVPAAAG